MAGESLQRFREQSRTLPEVTEALRLVVQRIGQDLFRAAVVDYWQGRCGVTGLDVVPLLRASHIKPWSKCATDEERLDVFNGLLLAQTSMLCSTPDGLRFKTMEHWSFFQISQKSRNSVLEFFGG